MGGAVDGEIAESLVLYPDGTTQLLSESKAPFARRLADKGGVEWFAAPAGRVLSKSEQQQLRQLAAQALSQLEPVLDAASRPLPWDIEFGFADEKLYLFQVRPLSQQDAALADEVVETLAPSRVPTTITKLDERLRLSLSYTSSTE